MSKTKIFIGLILIGIISIILKLYFVDFSLPLINDGQFWSLQAISHLNGDFDILAKKNPGWSLFLSPFYALIDSSDFLVYSNVTRIVSILLSTLAILPMYLLSRKFFNEKYSLVAACLLAFEPHLIYWSGFGYAESLYIPLVILTLYFIMNKNNKLVYISFVFAGFMWWTRLEGIIMIVIISCIFFVLNSRSKKQLLKYFICLVIFVIVISPILVQRNNQFDDPLYLYYNERMFIDDFYEAGLKQTEKTASNYVEDYGLDQFVSRFLVDGTFNVVEQTIRLSAPYLLILVPFGLLFSLRAFDQNNSFFKANWIMLLGYGAFMVIVLSTIVERRFLFALFPPLIIFAVLPIQRLVEYGLSTFSLTPKTKNISLVIVLCIILLLSIFFMDRFERKDLAAENEKISLADFLLNDLDDGHIFDPATSRTFEHGYLYYLKLNNPPGNFKNFKVINDPVLGVASEKNIIEMDGDSLNEIIANAKNLNVKYILVDEENNNDILDELYLEKQNYSFLDKIYDTQENGMKKLKIKVFEINFKQFTP
jgi:hypothetical protein